MIEITTSNSISEKPFRASGCRSDSRRIGSCLIEAIPDDRNDVLESTLKSEPSFDLIGAARKAACSRDCILCIAYAVTIVKENQLSKQHLPMTLPLTLIHSRNQRQAAMQAFER